MGIIDDFKKLFWVKKAVAESAAEKAVDKGKELAGDLGDKASDAWEKGKDMAGDIGEKVVTKAKEGYKEAKDFVSDVWDKKDDWTPKEKTETPNPETKSDVTDTKSEPTGDKTWDKVKETGKDVVDKAVNISDKAWQKTEEVSQDLWNKAKDTAGKLHQKVQENMDSMLEKAKDLDKKIEEEKDKVDANRDGWADKTLKDKMKEHESTLTEKDDFFERASRYADGDYSMGKPIVTTPTEKATGEQSGKEDTKVPDGEDPLPPLPKKKDDFADDAILDDKDEE